MKKIEIFLGAVLAGIAIGIGGVVYLSLENKIAGALLFTVGLYTICAHGLNLFTGKVGYAAENPPSYLIDLLVIWAGNFAGTWLTASALRLSRIAPALYDAALRVCAAKLMDGAVSLFVLGIFCGMLMYSAVDGYKRTQQPLILFVCVAGFILCGFEHCIADMFYFSMANVWSGRAVAAIIAISLGNSLGGLLIPVFKKLREAGN